MCLLNEPVNTTRVLTRSILVFFFKDRLLWIGKSKSNKSVGVSDCRTNLEIKNVDHECSAYGRRQILCHRVCSPKGSLVFIQTTVERGFSRVLARIFMPVQNSNSNRSARPYIATQLLHMSKRAICSSSMS